MRTFRTQSIRALLGISVIAGTNAMADELNNRIYELDQKIRIVERKLEIADETAATKAKEAATVNAGASGFALTSADKSFDLKLRGLIQADARVFSGDDNKPQSDTFTLRRVRPTLDGTVGKNGEFRITPEFAGSSTTLLDAYGGYRFSPELRLRIGKFKSPFGLERLQSGSDLRFIERAHPTSLAPNRDIGIQLFGDVAGESASYAFGIFNGVADGGSSISDTSDDKDFTGRIFLTPFKNTDRDELRGLSFGVAGSFGKEEGSATASGLATIRSPGQATVFSYRTSTNAADNVVADGDRVRWSPQLTYYLGSFGFIGEYVTSEQDVRRGDNADSLVNDAWQIAASYVLTGEENSFRGITPKTPFDLEAGTWGALELAARVSELDIDPDSFNTYADPAKSITLIQSVAIGLNWYLNRNLKTSLTYEQSAFEGGEKDGDREDEEVLFARLQVAF